MMKKKHVIAKLLVFAMLLCMLPLPAVAEDATTSATAANDYAVINDVTIGKTKIDNPTRDGTGPYVFAFDTAVTATNGKVEITFSVSPSTAKVYTIGTDATVVSGNKATYTVPEKSTNPVTLQFYAENGTKQTYFNVKFSVEGTSKDNGGGAGGSSKPAVKPGQTQPPTAPTAPNSGVAGFGDVSASAWYADAVRYVVDKGLFDGVGDGAFAPNANMTRAMMWTVLARYMGVDTKTANGNWYEAARTWAISKGISDGTMAEGNVSREQFVTMLWRLSGEPAVESSASFTDSGSVSGYAKTAVDWAVAQGIVNGYNDGSFNPQGSATRAEVAKMLTVFCTNAETSQDAG